MRLLQLHTCYSHYIPTLYRKHPGLIHQSFQKQTEAIIKDGYSAVHMMTPYLDDLGYEARTIFGNCAPAQRQWLTENGQSISEKHNWILEIVRRQIEMFQPDILYASDCVTFDSRLFRTLKWRPKLIMGWRGATVAQGTDWSTFDVMLSHLKVFRDQAATLGAGETCFFSPGFPGAIADAVADTPKKYDIVFSGQYSPDHTMRNTYLIRLAIEAENTPELSLGFFVFSPSHELPPLIKKYQLKEQWGMDMYRALRSGRIVFNAEADFAGGEAGNMRLFETTGVGSFMLTQHHDNITQYFEPGSEIETFRNEEEMISKVHHYLKQKKTRECIAEQGQKRCMQEHSIEQRAQTMDHIIKSCLQKKGSGMFFDMKSKGGNIEIGESDDRAVKQNPSDNPRLALEEFFASASNSFSCGRYSESLTILSKAKRLKIPFPEIDLLRAKAFYRQKQIPECLQALKEELRYFPDNATARSMYDTVSRQIETSSARTKPEDEFEKIYQVVAPYTMLGLDRLKSLYRLALAICERDVAGNIVECGVAAGGSAALLAYVFKHHSKMARTLFAFDTFEGMPTPTTADIHDGVPAEETGWGTGTCAAPVSSLLDVCKKLDVNDMVVPVKGDFCQTLKHWKERIGPIGFIHMDGDWYESTKSIFEHLYEQLEPEGIVQIDDYGHWDGCKKAVSEFCSSRNLCLDLKPIDYTGVWFQKKGPVSGCVKRKLLNLGCGDHFHPDWTNVDFVSPDPKVIAHDLTNGIPFEDDGFDAVYHSHLLEHFPKSVAPFFLKECCRVLKPGGFLRVAVPDLETIARLYLAKLESSLAGDKQAQEQYEWIVIELLDQMVRNVPGGHMLPYWHQQPMPAEAFVTERMGSEFRKSIKHLRHNNGANALTNRTPPKHIEPLALGRFRLSGEVHQWMYDRYSLGKLLKESGFEKICVCRADQSQIPGFNTYHLDVLVDGQVRKPDSLFIEALKPLQRD